MEALKKLEKVQTMLSFMQERDICSNHPDSDRFLAEFLVFMANPCGALKMEDKCHVIFEHLQKISAKTLEEASKYIDKDLCVTKDVLPAKPDLETEKGEHALNNDSRNMAMIGVDAMQQANSSLEDFCRSYFMFHSMDVSRPHQIFKFLPILFFTESFIYQLDSLNEKDLLSPRGIYNKKETFRLSDGTVKDVGNQRTAWCFETSSSNPFDTLIFLLQHRGLLTDRIERELKCGIEYWALERKLCHALLTRKKISVEDVVRTVHLKSFDYRVLNLLLYQLRDVQVNELHLEFLSVSELLVEISDDLYDYEEDVIKNSFNILRMFISIYGPLEASSMLAKFIAEIEDRFRLLSKELDPDLSSKYWRRCEEATAEGGKSTGHTLGTWNIPPLIIDEGSYRLEVAENLKIIPTKKKE